MKRVLNRFVCAVAALSLGIGAIACSEDDPKGTEESSVAEGNGSEDDEGGSKSEENEDDIILGVSEAPESDHFFNAEDMFITIPAAGATAKLLYNPQINVQSGSVGTFRCAVSFDMCRNGRFIDETTDLAGNPCKVAYAIDYESLHIYDSLEFLTEGDVLGCYIEEAFESQYFNIMLDKGVGLVDRYIGDGLEFNAGPGGWAHVSIDGKNNVLMVEASANDTGASRVITVVFKGSWGMARLGFCNNFVRIEQSAQ